jgi:hypothetical protein
MSFREITMSIRAINRASNEFNRIQTDAQLMTARIKSFGSALAGIGALVQPSYMANHFGF